MRKLLSGERAVYLGAHSDGLQIYGDTELPVMRAGWEKVRRSEQR